MFLALVTAISWAVIERTDNQNGSGKFLGKRPVPVEVSEVVRGNVENKRVFSGALEADTRIMVSPKINGRVYRILVDLGDVVQGGQILAQLDDHEHTQSVLEAEADLKVARATLLEAERALEITNREFERTRKLLETRAVSESEFDIAQTNRLAREAELQVAKARVAKAQAALAAARIRLGYTEVTAGWNDKGGIRVVAERFVDEGETISENTPLLTIVGLDPIIGVIPVTEKEYGRISPGQPVTLRTDAYPGKLFTGSVNRISPVFSESTRQARVEISLPNENLMLKPGMFIKATVVFEQQEEAQLVPSRALTRRSGQTGLFLLDPESRKAKWKTVVPGFSEGDLVQIISPKISGNVVILGQQFLEDGSPVEVVSESTGNEGYVQ